MTDSIILTIFTIFLLPGIIMAIAPGLPGLLYMLVVAIIFVLFDHFTHLTVANLGILIIVTATGMFLDLFSGIVGAKWGGAHWSSLGYGLLGLIIGSLTIPVPIVGSLVGLFLGILGAEWYRTSSITKAHKAALGSFAGSIAGMIGNGIAAVAFLVLFIVFAWK